MEISFKKILEIKTNYKKLRISPHYDKILLWVKDIPEFSIYNIQENSICDPILFTHPIRNINFINNDLLIITTENDIFSYDLKNASIEKIIGVTSVLNSFLLKNVVVVRKDKILFLHKTNFIIGSFNYSFIKYIDPYLILIFNNTIFIFNKRLKLIYDSFIEKGKNVKDVFIRNKKIYYLSEDSIFGHDLNIELYNNKIIEEINQDTVEDKFINHYGNDSYRLCISDKFIYLCYKNRLIVGQKNFLEIALYYEVDECVFSPKEEMCFFIKDGVFNVFKENLDDLFRYKLINESYFYRELEDEFDISDPDYEDIKDN